MAKTWQPNGMIPEEGGRAFPSLCEFEDGGALRRAHHHGMTLRDWYAGQAMPAIIALRPAAPFMEIAEACFEAADAMVAWRSEADL